ncbi:hypothetical protein [Niveispirillum sp. KHB5.9]|uniref:hypothetical protein n=1 Tax=Niveispirillum sp. KHB5.9 TaxID=3400269 RepID=UPI003A8B87CC
MSAVDLDATDSDVKINKSNFIIGKARSCAGFRFYLLHCTFDGWVADWACPALLMGWTRKRLRSILSPSKKDPICRRENLGK